MLPSPRPTLCAFLQVPLLPSTFGHFHIPFTTSILCPGITSEISSLIKGCKQKIILVIVIPAVDGSVVCLWFTQLLHNNGQTHRRTDRRGRNSHQRTVRCEHLGAERVYRRSRHDSSQLPPRLETLRSLPQLSNRSD